MIEKLRSVSFLEFADKLDRGEWGEEHEYFLEHIRKDILIAAWAALAEYAQLLCAAADYPPLLPAAEAVRPQASPLPTAELLSPLLRRLGYTVHDNASEIVALLYELHRKNTATSKA